MDSVRFGRALGMGARSAARALVAAADAAAAPNPSASQTTSPNAAANQAGAPSVHPAVQTAVQSAAKATARATVQTRQTRAKVARGSKRFGEAAWGPLAKLSGILWLEMTGAFFGIFALFGADSLWRHRADLHETMLNHTAHQHLLVYAAMTVLFTYFTVTSFLRARRKGR